MAKNSYSISESSIADKELRHLYRSVKQTYLGCSDDLDIVFEIAVQNRQLFPGINIPGRADETQYITHWVKGYYDANRSLPSKRVASPKGSCSDPAIRVIVQAAKDISLEAAEAQERHHNLFMSAENIQGNLLEEYIAGVVRPYGWIWCCGNILRAIDFCNSDGTTLLQVKNKSNTENSSSSAIREGTAIEKWYRLGTRTVQGQKVPRYMWDSINSIINSHRTAGELLPPCNMTEEAYQSFLLRVAKHNREMITDQ